MSKPIENIESTKSKALELIITTVLIAAGINLVIFGICTLLIEINVYLLIIFGFILIASSIGYILYQNFIKSNRKEVINAIVCYDKQSKSIINVQNYNFAEDIHECLNAAISEDSNIKGMWLQDDLGLTNIFNNVSPNKTYVVLSRSAALLNHLIEYLLLKKLSTLTTDYFNSPDFDKRKIRIITRADVADLITTNLFLNLFSKPTYERKAFDNKSSKMVYGYGKNGAIYDMFELYLPHKCKIFRGELNTTIIRHPYFKLTITPAFTGFGEVVSNRFIKNYLHQETANNISCFKVWVGIELKFSWKAILMNKTGYYKWIDNYIDYLIKYASFQDFIDKIQWNLVDTILLSNKLV